MCSIVLVSNVYAPQEKDKLKLDAGKFLEGESERLDGYDARPQSLKGGTAAEEVGCFA